MQQTEYEKRMAQAVADIRLKMAAAARAAGRRPEQVLLCAACKTQTVETVRQSAGLDLSLIHI